MSLFIIRHVALGPLKCFTYVSLFKTRRDEYCEIARGVRQGCCIPVLRMVKYQKTLEIPGGIAHVVNLLTTNELTTDEISLLSTSVRRRQSEYALKLFK